MPCRFDLVTLDTPDTDALAEFWCRALDLHVVEREDAGRWLALAEADGTRRLGLQRGDARPGGVHLDLSCTPDQFERERQRLLALGATEASPPRREPYGRIANLTDPDGHPFDLVAYDTSVA